MATKTKDSSSVAGKEKKANSTTTSTKRITKPSVTSSTEKVTPNPSEKQVPNYLKPTISSLHESSSSFKLPRSNAPCNKATSIDRRRSFDKPPSPSRLPKGLQQSSSPSRLPGPSVRSLNRCSTLPVKSTTNPSKPISERLSKTPKEGKTVLQPRITKSASARKSNPSLSTSNSKINATKSTAETTTTDVENEPELVKEAINEENREVERVKKNQEHEVETVSDIQPHVDDSEPEQNNGHDQNLVESDQPQIQVDDDEKVIPTVLEEEEAKQEQIKDEHEENENTNNREECNCNISESDQQEINHSTTKEVEVKEKEEESGVIIEDHKDESNQDEEKEEEKGETSERVKSTEGEEEHEQVESEVKEAKVESTKPKQQGGGVVQGKKESPVSNDVIEETASKLLERKNKVRALAGAFQTVIDYQTK